MKDHQFLILIFILCFIAGALMAGCSRTHARETSQPEWETMCIRETDRLVAVEYDGVIKLEPQPYCVAWQDYCFDPNDMETAWVPMSNALCPQRYSEK